jgi:hypothetical protein
MNRSSRIRWLPSCLVLIAASAASAQFGPPPLVKPVPNVAPAVGPAPAVKEVKAKDAKEPKDGITLLIEHFIDHTDPPDVARRHPCKIHAVKLEKETLYQIDLVGHGLDTYLRLLDADGKVLAEDDDSGGNLNARIRYTTTKAGTYIIVATSFSGGDGGYTLTVRNTNANPAKAIKLVKGQLKPNDGPDKARNVPCQVHTVALKANKTYVIDLESTDFDAYLRLESPTGKMIQEDDDSGGNLNSRIEYRVPADGEYRLVAMPLSRLNGNAANFTLRVTEKE